MNKETESAIICAVRKAFPNFPVEVETSPEDANILCVTVSLVPDDMIKPVRKMVYDLKRQDFPESSFVLLPIVLDIETTREHYPDLYVETQNCSLGEYVFTTLPAFKSNQDWSQPSHGKARIGYITNAEYALAA